MLYLAITISARIHWLLRRYAPSNIVLDRLRTRRGLKWSIPTAVILVPAYLYAASICTTLIEGGGPGWLNFVAIVLIWSALKLTVMAPVSVVMLAKVRLAERRNRRSRRYVPMGYEPGRSMGPWTTSA